MKVVIHLDGASVRGNERQAMLIGRGLQARGHEVVAATRRGGAVAAYLESHGLSTAAVRPRGDLDVFNLLRFAYWLRRQRPDALLLTSWKRAFVAGLAGRLAGVPRIVQRLGGPHTLRGGPRGLKQKVALTRWTDHIVVNSEGLRAQVLDQLPGLDPARVSLVRSAVDAEQVGLTDGAPAGSELRGELRRELGLPADAVVVLSVGGIEPLKGYEELVDALAGVDDGAHAVVAGGGSAERRASLTERAARLGVEGRLHLLGPRDDIPRLLAACDVFAHPSRVDSLPNAVMEAMAAGLPIVATDVPGVPEALEAGGGRGPAGWIVPRGDVAALTDTLREVVGWVRRGARAAAERAAEAGWRAEHQFGLERMVAGYEAVLRDHTEGGA